jgi:23S rRNA pseudouridine2604 synthase
MDINTFLTRKLSLSKEQVIEIIKSKDILIDGMHAIQRQFISQANLIQYHGRILQDAKFHSYILYYKPKGIECTLNPKIENGLLSAFPDCEGLFPVGRLDKESEGLLLLTDDGKLYKEIAGAEKHQEKEYLVKVEKEISDEELQKLASGIVIMGKKTRPTVIIRETPSSFRIILTQGLNRQIRRMCYKIGYEVVMLKRIRIMSISLGDMDPGEFKKISREEIIKGKRFKENG